MNEVLFAVQGSAVLFMIIIFASNILLLVDGVVNMYNKIFNLFRHAFK